MDRTILIANNGCVYSKIMPERNDFYHFGINATPEWKNKIIYNGDNIDLFTFNANFYGSKLIINGEKISEKPSEYWKSKTEVGTVLGEIISEPDWSDPDREMLQVAGVSYIFYNSLIKGDIFSGEYKWLRQKPEFIEIEGIKISIFPVNFGGGDGAGK